MRKKFIHPPQLPEKSKRRAEAILWDLYLQGPVEDPSGQATNKFADRLKQVGWPMSTNTVNRIVNGFGDRGGNEGDLYPYVYIHRELSGKRTLKIELIVDPDQVAFPDNPFEDEPAATPAPAAATAPKGPPVFLGTASLGPRKPRQPEPVDDTGETFARQRQFENAAPQPEPEPEAELEAEPEVAVEPEPEPEPAIVDVPSVDLEPYRSDATVRTNGTGAHEDDIDLDNLDDLGLPDDLFAGNGSEPPRSSMDMVAAAISILSDAMAAHAGEQMRFATDVLDQHIDERLGEYRILQDRLGRVEGKLRHTVTQYEKVVTLARRQRQQIVALQKELARYRPKATTST